MSRRWFRLPETGTGSLADAVRPDLKGHDVDGWAGTETHPDGAPNWVVRVSADDVTLDSLAAEPDVQALDAVPVTALNQMFGQNRDAAGWKRGFQA